MENQVRNRTVGKGDEKCSYSRLVVVAWFQVEFRLACDVCRTWYAINKLCRISQVVLADKSAGNAATNGDSGGIGGIPGGC
ncbi:hypothetical protein T09_5748 [Trichinella sp. T9]|nr:hypothetical protein T09_5748 [Trichinella sp. T9]